MPPPYSTNAKQHAWPKIERPGGIPVKATQRDLRRFRSLRAGLARLQATSPSGSPTTPRTVNPQDSNDPFLDEAEEKEVVEPLSWTALAYNGFMWWASAGEQARAEQSEESARDAELLADLAEPAIRMEGPLSTSLASLAPRRSAAPADLDEARAELATIAYFHRLTTQILGTLADVVESSSSGSSDEEEPDEDEEEEGEGEGGEDTGSTALLLGARRGSAEGEPQRDGRGLRVGSEAVSQMGLDVWSASDAEFVAAVAAAYFGRRVRVEGKGVEVCGVRVC